MALGKVGFAGTVYGVCSSPSVTIGEQFAECFLSFAECFGHSANSRSPVAINCLERAYVVVLPCVFPLKTFFVSLILPPFPIISHFDHFVMYLDTVHSILLSI